jgi:N-acetylglutamate synthase/N-acetylornithine aminotransferase
MIAPRLATMLSYVLTDAAVELNCLRLLLRSIADQTFNCVTVDGDMSTTILYSSWPTVSPATCPCDAAQGKHGS